MWLYRQPGQYIIASLTEVINAHVKSHCSILRLTCLYYQQCTDTLTSMTAQIVHRDRPVWSSYGLSIPGCKCKFRSRDHMLLHSCRYSWRNSWHHTFLLGKTADTVIKSRQSVSVRYGQIWDVTSACPRQNIRVLNKLWSNCILITSFKQTHKSDALRTVT
jgi:hypothetical protein